MGMLMKLGAVALAGAASIAYYEPSLHLPTNFAELRDPTSYVVIGGPEGTWTGDHDSHTGSHGWMSPNPDGSPGRFSSCEPVRYLVNDQFAAPGAAADVTEAFRRISKASGLTFEFVGTTDVVPTSRWAYQRYAPDPTRWAPVLIGWAPPGASDMLPGGDAAVGGPDVLPTPAGKLFVSGSVVLNSDLNDTYTPGFGFGASRGGLLMHELGHLVGLSHVDDSTQIMAEAAGQRRAEFGAGDRAGLAILGAGPCVTPPTPPY